MARSRSLDDRKADKTKPGAAKQQDKAKGPGQSDPADKAAAAGKPRSADKVKVKGRKRRLRGALSRTIMRVPRLRRWYIKRVIKYIDRSEAKGRALPEGLADTARYLSRVPKNKRVETLDKAIQANEDMPNMGREMRRASSRQRRSGQSDFHYRPGSAPGTFKQRGRPKVR